MSHFTTYRTATPHTTLQYSTDVEPVTHLMTEYQTVGTAPIVHTKFRQQGLGKRNGRVHRAPWHKNRNITVAESHLDATHVTVPVTRAVTDYHAVSRPYLSTHVDVVDETVHW